jgi:hypothetical protein
VDPTLSLLLLLLQINTSTQSGGPDASNTEKFPGDSITSSTIIYGYAETGTAATKSCSDENLWKSQLLQTKTNY